MSRATSVPRALQIGYMPLVDAAPLIAASKLGLDVKHGLRFELQRQNSWAAIRDKLLSGELDAVHALSGMIHGIAFGIGGHRADLAVLMTLNRNGQGIVLSRLFAQRFANGEPLAALFAGAASRPVFAQTFPTGTHAMWLYYWLAAHGIHPLRDIVAITLPPPLMAAAMAGGEIAGYCCGEPWGTHAETLGAGTRIVQSGTIWPDHPEKLLACRRDFVELEPETAVAMTAAVLEACRWLDAEAAHRREAAGWLARPEAIDMDVARLADSLSVNAAPAAGDLRFHAEGAVNMPYLSDGLWFVSQFKRWGLLPPDVTAQDCEQAVVAAHRLAEYRLAAARVAVEVPAFERRESVLCDGIRWTGRDPLAYAAAFALGARSPLS